MSWFKKLFPEKIRPQTSRKSDVPEGLWIKCQGCQEVLYRLDFEKNQSICPKCEHHHRINARERIRFLLDETGQNEIAAELEPIDRLKFQIGRAHV